MNPTRIAVFDFDGTLFRSPEKPLDWEGSWWGNIESLTSPVVPTTPGEDWWNLPVVERAKRDIANPEVLTALVTGRLASKFHVRVQDLLAQVGLKFDHVFFSPGGDTEAYKLDVIGQLLRDNYSARGVDIWEDRGEHLRKYADYVEAQGRAAFPHLITTSAHTPDVLRVARKFAAQERSIGLFLPLPKDLAKQFPSLGEKDDSPTHCTLLILGNVDPEDDDHLLATLMENLRKWPTPITATLKGLNYFDNQGTVVAYDRVRFNTDVARLRSDLVAALMDKGFSIDDVSPQNYYPHVTLEYMPPGSFGEYKGTVPQGSWEFDTVELWGMEDAPIEMILGDKVRPQRVAMKLCKPGGGVLQKDPPAYVCPEENWEGPEECPGGAVYDDGIDAWTCPTTGWEGPNSGDSEPFCADTEQDEDGNWICPSMMKRVAARYKKKTKDSEGNVHYEYSERQVANRHREKAERVEHLRQNISDLRARVKGDLTDEDPATRMIALVVALMDETCERVGNDESAEEGHFGVTGWQVKHVTFKGDTAVLKYVGKSGVKHEKVVETGPVVTALKKLTKGRKGEDCLFETDEATVGADDVNDYLAEFDITAKDIRGFRANDEMLKALKAERAKGPKELPRDRKEKDKILKAEFKRALEVAAEAVGHEAATLRSQYLVPDLEESYVHDGTILKALKVGTKTESEREDEEIEGLVKPLPKKKPPRHDLRKERLYTDDPDLDMTDDDLSMNYKKVASSALLRMSAVRVASRWLAAGEDDSSEEFQAYIKGETFPNPDPDTKDKHPEVSYSTLKEKSPEAAKKVYQDWAAKQKGKGDESQGDKDPVAKATAKVEELGKKLDEYNAWYNKEYREPTKKLVDQIKTESDSGKREELQRELEKIQEAISDPEVVKKIQAGEDLENDLKASKKELKELKKKAPKGEDATQGEGGGKGKGKEYSSSIEGHRVEPADAKFTNRKEYTARSENGSVILGTPHGGEPESDSFIKDTVLPEVDAAVKDAIAKGKKVVFLAEGKQGGFPDSEQEMIAQHLDKNYEGKIKQDTWDGAENEVSRYDEKEDTDVQVVDSPVIKKLTSHFGDADLVLAALLASENGQGTGIRGDSRAVARLKKMGIDPEDEGALYSQAFPQDDNPPSPPTEISRVVEAWNRMRQEHLIKRMKEVEAEGGVAIVVPGASHAYELRDAVGNLGDKGQGGKSKEDASKSEPKKTPEKKAPQSDDPDVESESDEEEESPAPSDLRDKIREGLKDVQGLSEDDGEELDDLFTSVMGESSSKKFVQDLQKATIEQAKALLNEGAKALSTGDTYDLGRLFSKMEDGVYDVGKDKGKLEDFSLEASEKRIQSVTGKRDSLQADIKKAQAVLKASKGGEGQEVDPSEVEEAEKTLKEKQPQLDQYNEALVRMTAFHASKAYLVSKMSDPSGGSLDPDERVKSLADNLDTIPKEVLDARKSRGTKEIKKLNKSMKSLDEAGKAEAKKKIDALEAEQMVFKYNDIASGTDEPKDTATRFIREFKDYGIENEHVRTLLVHGTRTEEGRAALWNLAKDLDTDDLIELAGPAGKGFEGATKDDEGNPINSRGHAAIRQAILSRMMLQEAQNEDGWDPEGVEKQIDALTNATKGMSGFSKNKNVQKWLWNTGGEVKKLLDKGGVKVKKSIQDKVRDAFPAISKETPEEWGDRMMEKSDKAEKRDEDESKKRQKELEQQAEKQMKELERKSDKAEKEREKANKKRETSKGKKTGHAPSSATIAARFLGYAGAGR
jgi:2'-5' RNA ligase